MRGTTLALALLTAAAPARAQDFYGHWADGRAELSGYRVVQPRYGEPREGHAVLVFVTEDVHAGTRIKVESPDTPESDRIYALKLNRMLRFTTGIYDYSMMTSVFSAVEPGAGGRPFEPLRITFTAQEWCGHVFEEAQVRGGAVHGELFSYFEAVGRKSWRLDRPPEFVSEDNLLIRIRELRGPLMEEGESRGVMLLPGLWELRLRHRPRALVEAVLGKGRREQVEVQGRSREAVPWTWSYGQRQKTVWVDTEYPHRILRWQDSSGASGELLASVRRPYWNLQSLEDEGFRAELGIP